MIIAVTPGDPEGIGPEIVWKSIQESQRDSRGTERPSLLCVGAREPFDRMGVPVIEAAPDELRSGLIPPASRDPFVWLLKAPSQAPLIKGSKRRAFLPGYQSGWAIEQATRLVRSGVAAAIATGPISKQRLQKGGYLYPGHTEFLAALCKTRHVTMMLANETLRISLVTTHLALKDVPKALARPLIRRAIQHTAEHLRMWWGIDSPRVAVAALNPHAGESGLFGKEEIRVIEPEIRALKKKAQGIYQLSGPHPADTLFAKHVMASPKERYDAVVCMYHDQGLIPVKLLDFPKTVNVTLGLPIVRTSVDHGVGFDIAGTGKADPSSLQSAIQLAIQITRNREINRKNPQRSS